MPQIKKTGDRADRVDPTTRAARRVFGFAKITRAAKTALAALPSAAADAAPAANVHARVDHGIAGIRERLGSVGRKLVESTSAVVHAATLGKLGSKPAADRNTVTYEEAKRRLREVEQAPVFPTHALGELGTLAAILSADLQVDQALAGACILFAMNVATTGHFNVQVYYNPTKFKPTTLNMHTLAHSGQGKTTTDNAVLGPMRAVFDELAREHAKLPPEDKGDRRHMHRVLEDMSEAAFTSELAAGPRMQSVCTSEGAAFYFSHAMNRDNLQKTAATLCKLWDDGRLSRVRLNTGRTELFGLRVPMHIAVQPDVIEPFLSNRLLSACGYWPRNLLAVCRTPSQRVLRHVDLAQYPEFRVFAERSEQLAARAEPAREEDCTLIGWEPEAADAATDYFNHMEEELARGVFRDIDPWVRRAADHVHRVAATFAAFAGRLMISKLDVECAIQIVDYSLACWRFVKGGEASRALRLWKWIKENENGETTPRRCIQNPHPMFRKAEVREACLDLLQAKGLLAQRDAEVIALS